MNPEQILNTLIDKRINEQEIYSVVGTVSNVNETTRKCDVTPIEGAKIYDVRLQSVVSGTNGFIQIPCPVLGT